MAENQAPYDILPNEIFMQGKINGEYFNHLKLSSEPTETTGSDGTVVTAIHHRYENVKKDTTISFTISEELKNRLGLETTLITIYKK